MPKSRIFSESRSLIYKLIDRKSTPQSQRRISPLLCVNCRGSGHVVDDCSFDLEDWSYGWFWSEARKNFSVQNNTNQDAATLCERCADLDIVAMLTEDLPWTDWESLNAAAESPGDAFKTLGRIGSLQLWSTCPLCRCLFGLMPSPSSADQDVFLVPGWTIHRLEEFVVIDEQKRKYSKCLSPVLLPTSNDVQAFRFSQLAITGDSICLVENDEASDRPELGGRLISRDTIDIARLQTWLQCCESKHPLSCTPIQSDALRSIRLIAIPHNADPKLVPYPVDGCEYMALSYVWGYTAKQRFQLGPLALRTLPQTFQDAVTLTRLLGKKYIWIDFVCIDQFDEEDKKSQIAIMANIYRGASATIVALSGRSANAGLARISSGRLAPQLQCSIAGRDIVGTMPPLEGAIVESPWGARAWTLQEALLSGRCIYMSDVQAYFECNAMQCCESLDDTHSQIHQLTRCENTDTSEENLGRGSYRSVSINARGSESRLRSFLTAYTDSLQSYSFRDMSDSKDAINAFSGILQDLTDKCGTQFYWGLPLDYFQWGLLWTAFNNLARQDGFPAWSWAGWKGPKLQWLPRVFQHINTLPTYLSVYAQGGGNKEPLFDPAMRAASGSHVDTLHGDPLTDIAQDLPDASVDIMHQSGDGKDGQHLVIEGIILNFQAQRLRHTNDSPQRQGFFERFPLELAGVRCNVYVVAGDVDLARRVECEDTFLLVARDRDMTGAWIGHFLLLLDFDGDVAQRVSTLLLIVPEEHLAVLSDTKPRMRRFILKG